MNIKVNRKKTTEKYFNRLKGEPVDGQLKDCFLAALFWSVLCYLIILIKAKQKRVMLYTLKNV